MFDPALSSSLKTMYAVKVPPMRRNESTEGKALSTASKASPCEPLEKPCGRVLGVLSNQYLKRENVGTTFLTVMPVSSTHRRKVWPRTTQVMLMNLMICVFYMKYHTTRSLGAHWARTSRPPEPPDPRPPDPPHPPRWPPRQPPRWPPCRPHRQPHRHPPRRSPCLPLCHLTHSHIKQ